MSVSSPTQAGGLPAAAKRSLIRSWALIVGAGVVLYLLSGGFPPTSWTLLIQVLSQWGALSAAQGSAAFIALMILILQSLLFAVAWGLFIWVIAREVSAYKDLQTQINLTSIQAALQPDVTASVVAPDLLPFTASAWDDASIMPPLQPQTSTSLLQREPMVSNPFEMQPSAQPAAQVNLPGREVRRPDQRPAAQTSSQRPPMLSNPFEMQPTSQVPNMPMSQAPHMRIGAKPVTAKSVDLPPASTEDQAEADPFAIVPVSERRSGGLRYTPESAEEADKPASGETAEQEVSPFDDVPKPAQRRSGGLRMSSSQQGRRGKNDPFAVVPDVFELFQEEQNGQKSQGQSEAEKAAVPVRNADNLGEDEFLYGNPFAGELPEIFNYDKDLRRSVLDIKEGQNDKK